MGVVRQTEFCYRRLYGFGMLEYLHILQIFQLATTIGNTSTCLSLKFSTSVLLLTTIILREPGDTPGIPTGNACGESHSRLAGNGNFLYIIEMANTQDCWRYRSFNVLEIPILSFVGNDGPY